MPTDHRWIPAYNPSTTGHKHSKSCHEYKQLSVHDSINQLNTHAAHHKTTNSNLSHILWGYSSLNPHTPLGKTLSQSAAQRVWFPGRIVSRDYINHELQCAITAEIHTPLWKTWIGSCTLGGIPVEILHPLWKALSYLLHKECKHQVELPNQILSYMWQVYWAILIEVHTLSFIPL